MSSKASGAVTLVQGASIFNGRGRSAVEVLDLAPLRDALRSRSSGDKASRKSANLRRDQRRLEEAKCQIS